MSETVRIPGGTMTIATIPERIRIGSVLRCTYSSVEGRTGEEFPINSKRDAEIVAFLDSYGDKFEMVSEGDGRLIRMF